MRGLFFLYSTILILLFTASATLAETRYISDQLLVTVRSNKSNNYKSLASLLTASAVEILEEDKRFVKVRTSKGVEGYILKQYVSKALPKATQIAQLKRQKTKLEGQLAQQQQEVSATAETAASSQAKIDALSSDLTSTKQELEKVTNDFSELKERAANVLDLTTERDQLLADNEQMLSQLTILQEENSNFHRSNMIQWFLAGGGVFLGGWLIGKISRKNRRYSRF